VISRQFFEMASAGGRLSHAGHTRLESKGREADGQVALAGFEAGFRMESPLGDEPGENQLAEYLAKRDERGLTRISHRAL
jgi:hypothetical protein